MWPSVMASSFISTINNKILSTSVGTSTNTNTNTVMSAMPVGAMGSVFLGAGALVCIYRLSVTWNTRQVAQYETKVVKDATTLLATMQASRPTEHEEQPPNTHTPSLSELSAKQSPFSPLVMGDQTPVHFNNRIIKAATYEALCDKRGVPLPGLTDFHIKMANGGCGMSIVAYAGNRSV